MLRCTFTGNRCGTDTWAIDFACHCAPCVQSRERRPPAPVMPRLPKRMKLVAVNR